jgi:hypothetical protein
MEKEEEELQGKIHTIFDETYSRSFKKRKLETATRKNYCYQKPNGFYDSCP